MSGHNATGGVRRRKSQQQRAAVPHGDVRVPLDDLRARLALLGVQHIVLARFDLRGFEHVLLRALLAVPPHTHVSNVLVSTYRTPQALCAIV